MQSPPLTPWLLVAVAVRVPETLVLAVALHLLSPELALSLVHRSTSQLVKAALLVQQAQRLLQLPDSHRESPLALRPMYLVEVQRALLLLQALVELQRAVSLVAVVEHLLLGKREQIATSLDQLFCTAQVVPELLRHRVLQAQPTLVTVAAREQVQAEPVALV